MDVGKALRRVFCGFVITACVIIFLVSFGAAYIFVGVPHLDDCPVDDRIPWMLIVKGAFYILLGFLRLCQLFCRCRRSTREVEITQPGSGGVETISNGDVKPELEYGQYLSGAEAEAAAKLARLGQRRESVYIVAPPVMQSQLGGGGDGDTEDDTTQQLEEPIKMNTFTLLECVVFVFLFIWFITGVVWVFRTDEDVQYDDPTLPTYCDQLLYRTSILSFATTGLLAFGVLFIVVVTVVSASYGASCCRKDGDKHGLQYQFSTHEMPGY